jgi:hypothetical protein
MRADILAGGRITNIEGRVLGAELIGRALVPPYPP